MSVVSRPTSKAARASLIPPGKSIAIALPSDAQPQPRVGYQYLDHLEEGKGVEFADGSAGSARHRLKHLVPRLVRGANMVPVTETIVAWKSPKR